MFSKPQTFLINSAVRAHISPNCTAFLRKNWGDFLLKTSSHNNRGNFSHILERSYDIQNLSSIPWLLNIGNHALTAVRNSKLGNFA